MKAASDVALDPEQARALALRAERHVINANQWERGARLSKFNDEHSHRAVLAAMQLSLAYAE